MSCIFSNKVRRFYIKIKLKILNEHLQIHFQFILHTTNTLQTRKTKTIK